MRVNLLYGGYYQFYPAGIALGGLGYFSIVGGTAPFTAVITVGALPPGLSIDNVTGYVVGAPTTFGRYVFTIQVTDSALNVVSQEYMWWIVRNPNRITGFHFTPGFGSGVFLTIGTPVSSALVLEGTAPGPFSVDTYPNDAGGFSADNPASLLASPGGYYSHVTGFGGPYFAQMAGVPVHEGLPPGVFMSNAGVFSGTPSDIVPGNLPYLLRFVVTSPQGDFATFVEYNWPLGAPPLGIGCGGPPPGYIGVPYLHGFPASWGVPPYAFSIVAGALPFGLALDPGTGIASGIPTAFGTYNFTVQVVDSMFSSATVDCSITVLPAVSNLSVIFRGVRRVKAPRSDEMTDAPVPDPSDWPWEIRAKMVP